jgi:DNA polymerase III delta prime subunit
MKCEIKYAPKSLDEVIYPSDAIERRIKGYAEKGITGHVMLHGPNGTGKTTIAKLLIEAIGGSDAWIDGNGYEDLLAKPDLRGYLMQAGAFARLTESGKCFLLLNEFDNAKKNLSKFWTALDDCGDDVMAIITTNHPMNIDPSIRSRFDMVHMPKISAKAALRRVQLILKSEGLVLPDAQVEDYLMRQEHLSDLRKYFKVADELLFLHNSQTQLPPWSKSTPSLQLV